MSDLEDRYLSLPVDPIDSLSGNLQAGRRQSTAGARLLGGACLAFSFIVATFFYAPSFHGSSDTESSNLIAMASSISALEKIAPPFNLNGFSQQGELYRQRLRLYGHGSTHQPRGSHINRAKYGDMNFDKFGGKDWSIDPMIMQEGDPEGPRFLEEDEMDGGDGTPGKIRTPDRNMIKAAGNPTDEEFASGEGAREIEWDPDGLFKNQEIDQNLLEKRMLKRQGKTDDEAKEYMAKERQKFEEQKMAARANRSAPAGDPAALLDFLVRLPVDEIPFEVARGKPLFDDAFFAFLSDLIVQAQYGENPNEKRANALTTLKGVIEAELQGFKDAAKTFQAPAEKLRKLLMSADKKATILEMVGNDEIDAPLIELLNMNVAAARNAGETQKADFLEKIVQACKKYALIEEGESALAAKPDAAEAILEAERREKAAALAANTSKTVEATSA